jgi:uncharacterized protein with LGFP repeats
MRAFLKRFRLPALQSLSRLGSGPRAPGRRPARRFRPDLEVLEERRLLNYTPPGGLGGGGGDGGGGIILPDPDPILTEYTSLGGANGFLGAPVAGELTVPDNSGQYEDFQYGSIYWSMRTGAHEIHGAIRDKWLQMGGTQSSLGYPVTDQADGPNGGHDEDFVNGSIYQTPDGHLFVVDWRIETAWDAQHREQGPLGYPTQDTLPGPVDPHLPFGTPTLYEDFQHGSIYWAWGTGAHEVQGAIRDKWFQMGGAGGLLGYPTSDQGSALNGGHYQHFTGGSIYQTPDGKVFEVDGGVEKAWKAQGWEGGPLGYPTQDTYWTPNGRGRYCYFQGGAIYALGYGNGSTADGYVISGDFLQHYAAMGWENSALGFPISNVQTDPSTGAQSQVFENGIMIADAYGWFELDGPIYQESVWGNPATGTLGLPTAEGSTPDGRGRYVHFENDASIYWTQDTGAHIVSGPVRDYWSSWGWEKSPLGYPISDAQYLDGDGSRYRIQFEHGVIQYQDPQDTQAADVVWAYQVGGDTIHFGWHTPLQYDKFVVDYGIRDPQTDQPLTANGYDADGGNGGSFDMHGANANTEYYFSVEGGTSSGLFGGYDYTGWGTPIEITLNQVTHPQPPQPPMPPSTLK